MENIIELKKIEKEYKMRGGLKALKAIDLSVAKGDFIALTGPSGSGKTTLMNILGFLDTADKGEYLFEGRSSKKLKEREITEIRQRKIGYIFQSFNLLPGLTALENITLPLIYSGISRKKRDELALKTLSLVGLKSHKDHHPYELSGGQKQRIAIARAVVISPTLILADEPTGNLDNKNSEEIVAILRELNNNGATVVLITHSDKIAAAANRKITINNGMLDFS